MSNFVEKKSIFEGMTMSQMKDAYSKMTAKERGQFAGAFVRAAKTAKKPAAKKPAKPKANVNQQQQRTATKPSPTNTRKNRQAGSTGGRGKAPSGTRGDNLPSNPKLKSQPKPKTKSKLRRGSGLGGRKKPTMFNLTAMLRELGGADPKTGRRKKN